MYKNKSQDRYYQIPELGGVKFVSVTTFLKIINKPGLNFWMQKVGKVEAERVASATADAGKEFHHIMEKAMTVFARKETFTIPNDISPNARRMFDKVLGWFLLHDSSFEGGVTEKIVWSEHYKYAGTLDYEKPHVIYDWKTCNRLYDEHDLQVHCYSFAAAEMKLRESLKAKYGRVGEISEADLFMLMQKPEYAPKPMRIVRIDRKEPYRLTVRPRREVMPFDWQTFDDAMCALQLWNRANKKDEEVVDDPE